MWKFYIILTLCVQWSNAQCGTVIPCTSKSASQSAKNFASNGVSFSDIFNTKLFEIMSAATQQQNLVYSPLSLQVLLSFIYTISDGKLYEELRNLLGVSNDRAHVANSVQKLINSPSFNTSPNTLIVANKLYYDDRFGRINESLRNVALNNFASEIEQINFLDPHKAASTINTWVSLKTRQLITNIISPRFIEPDTNAVLLNSLYFKSDWLYKFSIYDTQSAQFHVDQQHQVAVNMMFNEDNFNYGEFAELQASVIELPYTASDLSMMIILPNKINGLASLEHKLTQYNLETISRSLKPTVVAVKLPKFQIEFDVDMINPLRKLGLNALFNKEGKINLFKNQQYPISVDQLKHKTYIRINEDGTEAASSTFAELTPHILNQPKFFIADHPFVFVIRSPNATLFMGHIIEF